MVYDNYILLQNDTWRKIKRKRERGHNKERVDSERKGSVVTFSIWDDWQPTCAQQVGMSTKEQMLQSL